MEKPELYVNSSILAQSSADFVLSQNLELLQNKDNCVVLDVGCGPGNVTYKKLLPLLPSTTKKVIAVDISSDYIDYAKKHYQMDQRLSYEQLDILTDTIPNEYVGAFDLITSLFCFHYVSDHKKAFINIYKMLKPGGKVLISFMSNSHISNIYQHLYHNSKWTKYMYNFKNKVFISESDKSSKVLLEQAGFSQIKCEQLERDLLHDKKKLFGTLKSLNVFAVPKYWENEFIENHLEYLKNNDCVTVNDGHEQYHFPHTLSVITANKSL
ncbi:hypothetical protein RN001_013714 [Aquatica leii]|uniref:Methyltransferase domain-containing protein n=1 Tax=Aquatica leii TaxID=1421715 RepID=A0AAN7PQZ3_9COLE|nr:hypothetical protein RN001_013714 [Aquatica leii]